MGDEVEQAGSATSAGSDEPVDATEVQDPGADGDTGKIELATARPSRASKKKRDPRIGQVLCGRYRLERHLARGGMGRVYLATQLQLGRSVAVKVLNREFQDGDPQFSRRFCLEAAICARVAHPNVVTVHDYGASESGELFMAMEYLEGRTLASLIQHEAPLPAARTLHIALQIARALREAHERGVIHRDLKPGNIMMIEAGDDPDFVKVLDFGLVKLFVPEGQAVGLGLAPEQAELTSAGTLLGSPRYMSPEQIAGETLDPRTDVYSFGIILFQLAAGRPPFSGSTSVELIYKHIHEPAPAVSSVSAAADCPPELEQIIQRCLAKRREARFSSMAELIVALKQARYSITGATDRPPPDTGLVRTSLPVPAVTSAGDDATHSGQLDPGEPSAPLVKPRGASLRDSLRHDVREAAFQDAIISDGARVQPRVSVAALGAALLAAVLAFAGVLWWLDRGPDPAPAVIAPVIVVPPRAPVEAPVEAPAEVAPPAEAPDAVETPVAEPVEEEAARPAVKKRATAKAKSRKVRTEPRDDADPPEAAKKRTGRYRDNPY